MRDFALEAPRIRKPHTKTKAGCDVCKIRRVKCGEEEPNCVKCINFGTSCSYSPLKKRPSRSRYQVVPKLRPQVPSDFKFETDEAYSYLELFHTETSFQILSHSPDLDTLRRTLLQASTLEPSILNGITALGALGSASRVSALTNQYDDHWGNSNRHQQNALKLYSRAIAHMKDNAFQGKQDLRTTLLTCLVTLCFEAWTGNQELALQQMQTGINLVHEWKTKDIGSPRSEFSCSAPAVEEEIVQLFYRIAVQVIGITTQSARSTACKDCLQMHELESLSRMPEKFSSLKEAGFYQAMVFQWAMDLLVNVIPKHKPDSFGRLFPFRTNPKDELKHGFPEYDLVLAYIKRWSDGFEVLAKSLYGKRSNIAVGAAILKLQIIIPYVCLIGMLAVDEMVYDGLLAEFEEIVELAELVLITHAAEQRAGFCFDIGVVFSLSGTASKCRSTGIRRKAIALMLGSARREGVWDSILFGKMMEWHADVEEEFMENGQVPAWARIVGLRMTRDLQQRTAMLSCQQRRCASSDEVVTRRKTIFW